MAKASSVQERISETAARLFYHQGYYQTGINQIIAEADIAIGSLYKHFKSKQELLYHYLEQQELNFFSGLAAFIGEETDPKKMLLLLIDYRIKLQQDSGFSGCHFIKINAEIGREDSVVQQFVQQHKEKHRHLVKNLLMQIGEGSKAQLADGIFLMIEGGIVSATIYGHTKDLETVKATVKGII
ncbi:TetR family transcriptional regulator [Chitinophaga skermanii]|uniref:TetR family transcriptional regulator n=1 Tax=Chitinophaga skermanii TaxID=331697 RepID=A0A327Q8P6_9BACT|nr:TetR/AcrR family transcriptional regulator [Chitinophaga skermanii]RAJ00264.1 TetR family transcriptional regulator [Chitinophaga skermanii]